MFPEKNQDSGGVLAQFVEDDRSQQENGGKKGDVSNSPALMVP